MKAEILIEHYAGANGPTLRIATNTRPDLEAVYSAFAKLADGDATVLDFAETLRCRLEGIESVVAQSVAKKPSKSLTVVQSGVNARAILWSNTREQWADIVAMVNGMFAQDAPGHQYLTRENGDDALVELCYRE